ncbi:hypothetical protein AB0N17_34375 [Streptomyces sp. NPDC051133]|uniref:hypothetical protein n=1 Tax=Streptomyces sp. NPDC051133 TaxID=3155521 RepID=UPI00341507C4
MKNAGRLHTVLVRHPWLVRAIGSRLLHGTGKARYDDISSASSRPPASRPGRRTVRPVPSSRTSWATRTARRGGGEAEEWFGETPAKEAARPFPRLRARLGTAATTAYADAADGTYAAGLRALLEGLRPGGGPAPSPGLTGTAR